MDVPDFIDDWWASYVGLFPGWPFWNPYGAGLALLLALRIAFWIFHIIDRHLWRHRRPEPGEL